MEYLQLILFVVAWFVLQKWILPKFGIPTWMEPNGCRVPAKKEKKELKELDVLSKPSGDQQSHSKSS